MMKKTMFWRVCLLLMLSGILPAEVYEWVDQNGRNHYSDRQHENARQLKVDPPSNYYRVERVFDGDTLLLADGRKIRLLGINTPEVAMHNKSAEIGGEQAKAWLRETLEGKQVSLEYDVEKEDKYHRTLAYVFDENKRHINLALLERGLATINIYPLNLKYLDVLLKAQSGAEMQRLGVWGEADHAAMPFEQLNDGNNKGWKRLTGRVLGVKQTKKYSFLQFSGDFSVKIDNQWLSLFPDLNSYLGKRLEVRGWINKREQRFTLLVRHPADIKILPQSSDIKKGGPEGPP